MYAYWIKEGKIKTPIPNIKSESIVKLGTELELISDEGAEIYYTIDGTDPTMSSLHYKNPISIVSDITIKAIAVKDGYRSSDIATFTYKLAAKYTATFNSNGGSSVESQTIEENGKVKKPDDPVKEGYNFTGWYLDGILYDFDTVKW